MARAATTSDVFNAIAEPRRRAILQYLDADERPVNDVVKALELDQPSVSKHLGVLKQVGLVRVRQVGRQRLYSTNGTGLRTVHDWTKQFERFWGSQLERLKTYAEQKARIEQGGRTGSPRQRRTRRKRDR